MTITVNGTTHRVDTEAELVAFFGAKSPTAFEATVKQLPVVSETCPRCGGPKPIGQSCLCVDNGCQ